MNIAVPVGYNMKTKDENCKIEELRQWTENNVEREVHLGSWKTLQSGLEELEIRRNWNYSHQRVSVDVQQKTRKGKKRNKR